MEEAPLGLTEQFNEEVATRATAIFEDLLAISGQESEAIAAAQTRAQEAVIEAAGTASPLGGKFDDPEYLKESVKCLYGVLPEVVHLVERERKEPSRPARQSSIQFNHHIVDNDVSKSYGVFVGAICLASKATGTSLRGYIRKYPAGGFEFYVSPESDPEETEAALIERIKKEARERHERIERTFGSGTHP